MNKRFFHFFAFLRGRRRDRGDRIFLIQLRQAMLSGPIVWSRLKFPGLITIVPSLMLAGIADAIASASDSPESSCERFARSASIADLQRKVDDVAVATDRLLRDTVPPPPAPPLHITACSRPAHSIP